MKNRTIKFRVWDVDSSDMIQHKDLIMGDVYLQVSEEGMRVVMDDPEGENGPEVRDAVIMQYTGLKDKHGKEIYEGDVIKSKFVGGKPMLVIYDPGKAAFSLAQDEYYLGFVSNRSDEIVVIGNIYENPELCQ